MAEMQNITRAGEVTRILRDCARSALKAAGYHVAKAPGVGRAAIWILKKNGQEQIASIRTTQDRWIAFPRISPGWKTLDDVEVVVVAAVDDRDDPRGAEVYLLPADEVRKRFDAAYEARTGAGLKVKENFGMWVGLDHDGRGIPGSAGSGIVDDFPPVATTPLPEKGLATPAAVKPVAPSSGQETISDVLADARRRIARIAGVAETNVKLDLHIGAGA